MSATPRFLAPSRPFVPNLCRRVCCKGTTVEERERRSLLVRAAVDYSNRAQIVARDASRLERQIAVIPELTEKNEAIIAVINCGGTMADAGRAIRLSRERARQLSESLYLLPPDRECSACGRVARPAHIGASRCHECVRVDRPFGWYRFESGPFEVRPEVRRCSACCLWLDSSRFSKEFSRNKSKTGLATYCKTCKCHYQAQRRIARGLGESIYSQLTDWSPLIARGETWRATRRALKAARQEQESATCAAV